MIQDIAPHRYDNAYRPRPPKSGDRVFFYQDTHTLLSRATGQSFTTLHIMGGGAQAKLLCRMTAGCIGLPVLAGPVEATALGNVLIQLVALGELADLEEGRALIARTQPVERYEPEDTALWADAFHRYQAILNQFATKGGI